MKLKNLKKASKFAQEYGIINGTLELMEKRKIQVNIRLTEKDDPDDVIVTLGTGFSKYITKALAEYKADLEKQIAVL